MLNRNANAGFTLVEVMVTVFVVAIGLLAAAGLQAVSKKAAVDAIQRTTASVLAQDMLERVRSNPGEITAYASRGSNIKQAPSASVSCGGGSNCSSAQLVDYDLKSWWSSLDGAAEQIAVVGGTATSAGGLRSPTGCIRYDATSQVVEVVVAWRGLSQIEQAASTSTDDPTSDVCGADRTDDYGTVGTQSFRRVLRLKGYIQSLT